MDPRNSGALFNATMGSAYVDELETARKTPVLTLFIYYYAFSWNS